MKLSFILPCYNVGRYIADTLGSIFAQGMREDEFEVICVNDCSTDNTRDIIVGIQALHSNLTLLDQPRNMYSGAARNRGLEVAKGKYIWFVDADDMVKADAAVNLVAQMEKDGLDILLFNYDEFPDGHPNVFLEHADLFKESEILSGTEFVHKMFQGRLSSLSLLWTRIVRRAIIEDNAIRFPDLYISQDCPFAWESLLLAKRVKSLSERYYNYRSSTGSITADKNTAKKAAVWVFQFPVELRRLEERLEGKVPETVMDELERCVRHEVNLFPKRYSALPEEEKTLFFKAMKNEKGWYGRFKSCLSMKNRILYHFRLSGDKLFRRIVDRLG